MKRISLLLVLTLATLAAGCAVRALPEEALREVDPSVEYSQVKADPQRYLGTVLLLGGRIVRNDADRSGSTLEVLRYVLDRWGYPAEVDESGGRFLARSDRFLDPEVYAKDRFIVLTGEVAGQESRELNGVSYAYPLFRIRTAKVIRQPWGGYGVPYGYPHPYYRPYDPFWYDPFWYDPFWRSRGPWHRYDPFWYR